MVFPYAEPGSLGQLLETGIMREPILQKNLTGSYQGRVCTKQHGHGTDLVGGKGGEKREMRNERWVMRRILRPTAKGQWPILLITHLSSSTRMPRTDVIFIG